MAKQNNLTPATIAKLNCAFQLWAMAKRQTCSQTAAAYYNKAYTILRQEMGNSNAITLELRKEMTPTT